MKLARASRQLLLLDTPPRFKITGNATARNAYGRAAQEIVCRALGLDAIAIDGTCETCLDAEGRGNFWEIKSVHRTGKVVIYDFRMQKEQIAGVPLRYAILIHGVRGCRDGGRLIAAFADNAPRILSLDAVTVHLVAMRERLTEIKSTALEKGPRFGYTRAGYADGYRSVRLRELIARPLVSRLEQFVLHGVPFRMEVLSE